MQNNNCKKIEKQKADQQIALNNFLIEEIKRNDNILDLESTCKNLADLGSYLEMTETDDPCVKDMIISGMAGIISALSYVSLMHNTIKSVKGGASC